MTDSVTREHRSKLLTRRVRAVMRAFNKNPKYISDAKPNITWDDSFIPPELYVNLKSELESLDAKESQQEKKEKEKEGKKEKMQEKKKEKELEKKELEKKARESQWQKMVEQITKNKANAAQSVKERTKKNPSQDKENPNGTENSIPKWTEKTSRSSLPFYIPSDDESDIPADVAKPPDATKNYKRNEKDAAQDKEDSDDAEKTDNNTEKKTKRKWNRKTSESVSASYDTSTDEAQAEPPAKRAKIKKPIDEIPPCGPCTLLKKECISKGFPAACESCYKAKKRCNLSRGANRRPKETQTTTPLRKDKKSIAELDLSLYRSSTEDEEHDVDQLDPDIPNIVTIDLSPKMPKNQSKIKSKPPPPKASSNSMEEGSSSRNFDFEHMKQQLKVSQEELRIAQQQLQLANSRIEAQQKLYESQRDLYETQLQVAGYHRRPQVRGQGSGGKAMERT